MFDQMIRFSLNNRALVVFTSVILLMGGFYTSLRLNLDVFPDLNAPTVTVLTEAHGMAPEQVETMVTLPLESAFNGSTGVRRVRSFSSSGLSIVHVEFEWSMDIYHARQIVSEKLQTTADSLPEDISPPIMAPMSSIMGEVMLIGLQTKMQSKEKATMMDLRTFADWQVRRRLMAIPGVAQVSPIGGKVKEYQVSVIPERLAALQVSMEDAISAAADASHESSGGVFRSKGKEYQIRGLGLAHSIDQLSKVVVKVRREGNILLEDVATIQVGPAVAFGSASSNGQEAVVLSITKQPNVNSLELTERIDRALAEMKKGLPRGIEFQSNFFRQADFIEVAIDNVLHALRDGALLVFVVLFLFLGNVRITFISILAIPFSLAVTFLVFHVSGLELNTMTLGGIGIAIGALVDDAIIDVENVYRRLRENARLPEPEKKPAKDVVYLASQEIRKPMVGATLIITIVFFPLFFLSGVEGRLLQPMGLAYVISIFASLFIALTVTPVLASFLLPRSTQNASGHQGWLAGWIKPIYENMLRTVLHKPAISITCTLALLASALFVAPYLGRSFLPEFNEGALTISYVTAPDISLTESNKIGLHAEQLLLANKGFISVQRRTGRAELDEHAQPVNAGEIEVVLNLNQVDREIAMRRARKSLDRIPGVQFTVGQPISHRIDHMLSGTRASIAVKIFGPNMETLRNLAEEAEGEMEKVPGVVDLAIEPLVNTAQLSLVYDREVLALYGLKPAELSRHIETAFNGKKVGRILEGQKSFDLVVKQKLKNTESIESLRSSLIQTADGSLRPLSDFASIQLIPSPNQIGRENGQRKLVVQANVSGRDLGGVVDEIRNQIDQKLSLPDGYHIEFGGQFESEAKASKTIWVLSLVSIALIAMILYQEFQKMRDVIFALVNLPLSLIGGIWAVWLTDGIVSIASLVGFITLFGIAVRNGILLISHYNKLQNDGKNLYDAVYQGSMERLNPILMTALTAALALIPLANGLGQPGKEIEAPMAIVILGGLITSTFLNMIVIPPLYLRFSKNRSDLPPHKQAY